jgi:hypothetical protein
MNIIEEKLKFIVGSELGDGYKLNELSLLDYDDYSLSIDYIISYKYVPDDNRDLIDGLSYLDVKMMNILKKYKFLPNGKMLKSEASRVDGMYLKIIYEMDEVFDIHGTYLVSWD